MLKANYHTHTKLCNHAEGMPHDYVDAAVRYGMTEIGISDHAHTPESFLSEYDYLKNHLNIMMTDDEFENIYKPAVLKEKERTDIKVFLGLETEYMVDHHDFFVDLRKKVDYLILGLHFFDYGGINYKSYNQVNEETIHMYTEVAIRAMSTGLYTIFAHPDLFMYGYESNKGFRVFDDVCEKCSKEIIDAAIKYDVVLEVNANGIKNTHRDFPEYKNYLYPREEFWELVRDTNAKIIVGADAHSPIALANETVADAIKFAEKMKLKTIDYVNFKPVPNNN